MINIFKDKNFDVTLFAVIIGLTGFGLIMIYSSSSVLANRFYSDQYYFLKKQILFASIGFFLMLFIANLDIHLIKKFTYFFVIASFALLFLVFIPGIGHKIGGAYRWITLGPLTFQPSEIAKLIFVLYLAYSISKKIDKIKSFKIGFLPHVIIGGCFVLMILLEPDFGTAVVLILVLFLLLFIGGVRLRYLLGSVLALLPLAYYLIMHVGYRRKRILAFLNPWADPKDSGFQIIQSFIGMHSGHVGGTGLGQGTQKLFYLPQAHTDFIFSVIGEEIGFIGVFLLVALFIIFLYRGIVIGMRSKDNFGMFLAFGITMMISIQVLINIGVVIGALPTKGITLPFISYGGSSLIMTLVACGLLLSISKREEAK